MTCPRCHFLWSPTCPARGIQSGCLPSSINVCQAHFSRVFQQKFEEFADMTLDFRDQRFTGNLLDLMQQYQCQRFEDFKARACKQDEEDSAATSGCSSNVAILVPQPELETPSIAPGREIEGDTERSTKSGYLNSTTHCLQRSTAVTALLCLSH
jgi:hypothetical protein